MPVSQAFYEKLKLKLSRIYKDLGYSQSWVVEILEYIDIYLRTGDCPDRTWRCDENVLVIFFCIKGDIDAAMKRSADCRRRAAERKSRKKAEDMAASQCPAVVAGIEKTLPRQEDVSVAGKRNVKSGFQSQVTSRSRSRVADAPTEPVCWMANDGK